jgi:hypothetical protein
MQVRELYHGTDGDNILGIIRSRSVMPNRDGKIFFSENNFSSVLMHGPDEKRKASFALKLRVTIPNHATLTRKSTDGVTDTLEVSTAVSLHADVLELYVRDLPSGRVTTIRGVPQVLGYLLP